MKKVITFLLFCCATSLSAQQIWHVNQAATGGNNGNTWADAFTNLQSALAVAEFSDQIWVAKGTYFPTEGLEREISFNLPKGVRLYGGFYGDEVVFETRNTDLNVTILSGDIGVTALKTDNSYHVVTIYQGDENTVLDGFTITKGYANYASSGFPHEFGGGVLVSADGSWPLATPVIAHCRLEGNRAGSGGGLACVGVDDAICSPDIRHCIFVRNRGEYQGGALFKTGRNRSDRAFEVYNCRFEDNYCFQFSGGIAIINPSDTVRISQCAFIRDSSRLESGGIYLYSDKWNVRYEIDSCDFKANYSVIQAGAISHMFPGYTPLQKVELIVSNSVFLLNRTLSGTGAGIASIALSDLAMHRIQIKGCRFESNYTQNGGAGIFIQGGDNIYTEVFIDRCFFLGNKTGASSVAGAFYYRAFGSKLAKNQNTITNSVFMYNDGAIASFAGKPGISHTRVANCSFYENGAIPFVKYWGVENNPVDLVSTMQFLNSVIWEPQTAGVHRLFYNNDPSNFTVNDYLVEHSMIHLSSCNYNGVDPCKEGMIYEQWPNFIDPFSGQLGLLTGDFEGRNSGSNVVIDTLEIDHDYYGSARVYCDTVDMGAYEIGIPCISNTNDLFFSTAPLSVHLIQNPVQIGTPIGIELFSAKSRNLQITLVEASGRVVWKGSLSLLAFMPGAFSVPSENLSPGLFYLQIMDELGQSRTEKVLVF